MNTAEARRVALEEAAHAIVRRIKLLDDAAKTLSASRTLSLAGQREGLEHALAAVMALREAA